MPQTRPLDLLSARCVPVHLFAEQVFCEAKLDFELRHPDVLDLLRGTAAVASVEGARERGRNLHASMADSGVPASPHEFRELLRSGRSFTLLESAIRGSYKGLQIIGKPDLVRFDRSDKVNIIEYKVRSVPRAYPSDLIQLSVYGFLVSRSAQISPDRIRLTCCVIDPATQKHLENLSQKKRARIAHSLSLRHPVTIDGTPVHTRTAAYDEKRTSAFLASSLEYWKGRRAPLPASNKARCRPCLVNAAGRCSVAQASPAFVVKPVGVGATRIHAITNARTADVSELGPLYAIPGMQSPVADLLIKGGINTLEGLARASAERVGKLIKWNPKKARAWPLRARAALENRPISIAPFRMPDLPRICFDIETDDWGGKDCIWAIAAFDEKSGRLEQWHLRRLSDQRKLLRDFARYLTAIKQGQLVAYSGSHFDERLVVHHLRMHDISAPNCLKYVADVYWDVWRSVAVPGSHRLKPTLAAFGIPHSMASIDGRTAAAEAMHLLRSGEALPDALLLYNREDARTLPDLLHAVEDLCGRAPRKLQRLPDSSSLLQQPS